MKKASTIMSIALAFALVATAALAGPASEDEASAATTEQEMVRDPSTGEMIKAPQYGGVITYYNPDDVTAVDTWWGTGPYRWVGLVVEKLGIVDWSTDRDKWDFSIWLDAPLEVVKGNLAESFETPDPLTIIFHIREGVHWQDKAPMNGRELTADDVVFNFHRMTGLGSGFTEQSPFATDFHKLGIESITASDKSTVVIKLQQLNFFALETIYFGGTESAWIYPPEAIKEHGNVQDWRNLIGTGPYSITDWVQGSAVTYTKNPNYWAFDEKFPENLLPYADEIQILVIPDPATQLAALRSGKIDLIKHLSAEQAESLQRTNPELGMTTSLNNRSTSSYAMDVRKPPFDDIRVRQAMQLALDNESINTALHNGLAWTTPLGTIGVPKTDYRIPFEEWPEEVQTNYGYDPERAERLLDEAGYPRGADGIRFKTTMNNMDLPRADLEYAQIAKDSWSQIGVDVEIKVIEPAVLYAHINNHDFEGMIWAERGNDSCPLLLGILYGVSNELWNGPGAQDPEYDALIVAAENASIREEMQKLLGEADLYFASQHWSTWGPIPPFYHFSQPWIGGFNGEFSMGGNMHWTVLSRVWVDQELKQEMGR